MELPESLTLWSIQSERAWAALTRDGVLRGDGRRVAPLHRPAYRWLMEAMRTRIPTSTKRFPVWAWYHPKPDLRNTGHLPSGWRGVRIQLHVPRTRVLLSDFELWHFTLQNDIIVHDDAAYDAFHAMYPDRTNPEAARTIEASWEHIFAIDRPRTEGSWFGTGHYTQATFEELRWSDIVSVRHFVGR